MWRSTNEVNESTMLLPTFRKQLWHQQEKDELSRSFATLEGLQNGVLMWVFMSTLAINTRPQSYHLLMLLLSLSLVFTTIGINKLMRPRCSLLQTLTVYCPNPECRTFKMLLDVVVFKFCSLLGSRGLCGLTQLLH